ncbi:MAG: hypothetical protein M3460_29835 [Actinomycetota bacterium]|nr:hypothetical protein [Actinomycetota bacterium]
MLTQTEDGQQMAAAGTTADQLRAAAVTTTQRMQDLMVQVVRQGQDISLKSLQVWADLARQLDPTALRSPASPAIVSLAYDLFEKLLAAQRQVIDELVATQRQLAQQFFDTTATAGKKLVPR